MLSHPPVDLRSDTVTRPCAAMRRAMAEAAVGDVCWGDDPTVGRLESVVAERLGKEAAMFVPSGTMANQIGLSVHTSPGDAVLCERRAHIACWEGGAAAVTSGLQLLDIDAPMRGLLTPAAAEIAAFPAFAKAPRMRLLALENTHNGAGGAAHHPDDLVPVVQWARGRDMAVHLDGARLFNAAVALGIEARAVAAIADTVSVCFSKGLGAPIGSVLAGPQALMGAADRVRHRLGGGWRQAGVIAAAALYALKHNTLRLAEDHERAARLAAAVVQSGVASLRERVETNLIYVDVDPAWGTAADLVDRLAADGVLVGATGPQSVRLVTHLDITEAGLTQTLGAIARLS